MKVSEIEENGIELSRYPVDVPFDNGGDAIEYEMPDGSIWEVIAIRNDRYNPTNRKKASLLHKPPSVRIIVVNGKVEVEVLRKGIVVELKNFDSLINNNLGFHRSFIEKE